MMPLSLQVDFRLFLLIFILCCLVSSSAFTIPTVRLLWSSSHLVEIPVKTVLFSTNRSNTPQQPPRQPPRRNLKKRRKRQDKKQLTTRETEFPWETAESRPIVSSRLKEAGEDYWIDEEDLVKSLERQEAIKNRKAMEGEIPKEKLWTEVFAPYKQNWIGIFSMFIVILATIVIKFPELLNQPVIPIPDL